MTIAKGCVKIPLTSIQTLNTGVNMLKQDWNSYWKTVVDTIHDGVMIVDNQGRVVSINKGMERITGFRAKEMVGQSCTMLN